MYSSFSVLLLTRPPIQASKILSEWAQLPISWEVYLQRVHESQKKHFPSCKPLPGVPELLQTLSSRSDPPVYMALATSSHRINYNLKTDHLASLFQVFPSENIVLGDDPRIPPGRGKPAPDIYLLALDTINERLSRDGKPQVNPEECLVFEDSVPGVEAGRRAGMQVVWCPHPELYKLYSDREERVLAGLMGEHKEIEEKNESIGVVTGDGAARTKGAPGEIGDDWGVLVHSLENFPHDRFQINIKKDGHL